MYRVMLHNDSSNRCAAVFDVADSPLQWFVTSIHYTTLACCVMVYRREYVVRVLMKVVDGLTVDDAVNVMQVCTLQMLHHARHAWPCGEICTPSMSSLLFTESGHIQSWCKQVCKAMSPHTFGLAYCQMQEAHQNGMACVIECAQEDAERYCEGLRGNGLIASVEPAGGGSEGKPSD